VHIDIPNAKTLSRLDRFHSTQPFSECVWKDPLQAAHRRFRYVQRYFPQSQHLRQSIAMIRMFVGNDDRIEPVDIFFNRRQPRQRFPFPKPGIDKDACAVAFQQR
jgi:hypothetical protein